MKICIAVLLVTGLGISLSGCNTWAGLGQDIQSMGHKMENQGKRKSD